MVSGNVFSLDNSYGLPNATLNIPEGVEVTNSGKSFTIGKVTGGGTLGTLSPNYNSGVNTWRVGSLNEDFTFYATVKGTGTMFEKVGNGTMTITKTNTFTGSCTISPERCA